MPFKLTYLLGLIYWLKHRKSCLIRLVILSFQIKFKCMNTLTNKIQILLYFPKVIKFNAVIYLNSIKKRNIHNLRNYT